MPQARIRTKATHDPSSMEGQAYVPHVLAFEFTTSGSGASDFYYCPPATLILEAFAVIEEALDAGTVDIGTDGTPDALIDNTEWTETTVNQYASSRETTAPDGLYLPDGDQLRLTVAGATSTGKVRLLLTIVNLDEVFVEPHNTFTV